MTATAVRPEIDLIGPEVEARRPWREAGLAAAAVWSASIVVHVLVSALAWLAYDGNGPTPDLAAVVLTWNGWDAGHYVRIA